MTKQIVHGVPEGDYVTSCDDCSCNSGVHGEEIICDLDRDPFDCPRRRWKE